MINNSIPSRTSMLHAKEAISNMYISDILESLFPLCDRHGSERLRSCFDGKQVSLPSPSTYIVALPCECIINGAAEHMPNSVVSSTADSGPT